MPKIIIDTDLMAEDLKKGKFTAEGRAVYVLSCIRAGHTGGSLPKWMSSYEPVELIPEKKGASIGGYSPAFLKFWEAYPSRNGVRSGKAQAMKCWKKVKGMKESELLEACLKALEWQKQDEQWQKDKGMFVPMATTYINQRRWEDEGQNSDEYEEYLDMNGVTRKRLKK